jgi:hypothetical protein
MTDKEKIISKQITLMLKTIEEIDSTVPDWVTDQYAYKFGFLKAYVEQHLKDMKELVKQESK